MANQIPIKVMCDGSGNTCGLAQFTSSDSVAIAAGGTGLTSQGICEFVQPGLYAVGCKVTYLGICAGKADTGVGHDNTYVGYAAGTAVTTGCQHTLIGKDAGCAITTCSQAVSIGYHAGNSQTFGMENTYVGYAAGASATTADNNTAIGWQAGTNTICSNNTSVGTCAMFTNTQGQDNVAIGVKAGATQAAAGCNNVFVGSCVGAVALCSENTIVGAKAGVAQTSGVKNVFLGACVGYGVQGGANNVYLGHHAGLVNTSGNANVFIGNCAGAASTASCCLIIGNGTCDLIVGNFNNGIVRMNCVGIGSYTPDRALSVVSSMSIDSNASGTGSPQIAFRQAADKAFITYWDASDTLALTNGAGAGLHFDPTNVRVGIGTAAPDTAMHIYNGSAGSVTAISGAALTIEDDAASYLQFLNPADTEAGIIFGRGTDNNHAGIFYGSDEQIYFTTDNSGAAVTIDCSQQVGIGTTVPAVLMHLYAGATELDIQSTTAAEAARIRYRNTSGDYRVGVGARTGGGNFEIKSTSCTGGMTMTALGNLNVMGVAASATADNGAAGIAYFVGAASDSGIALGSFTTSPWRNWIQSQQENGTVSDLILQTRGANVGIGTNGPGYKFEVLTNANGGWASRIQNEGNSSPYVLWLRMSGASTTTTKFLQATDNAAGDGNMKFIVYGDGDVVSATNSYTSDAKLKQDIVDVRSYWDDFKAVRFRKFRFKSDIALDENAPLKFGVVAQEIEEVFPTLVNSRPDTEQQQVAVLDSDGNARYTTDKDGSQVAVTEEKEVDLGTTTKTVKYSVLNSIGLKVIQELQTRLEAAEAKITTLEAA